MLSLCNFLGYAKAQNFEITRIDSTNNVGRNCIIKIDSSGNPHILYNDDSNFQLKHAVLNQNGEWSVYETGLVESINDFEIDNSGNIHCSKANYSTLRYLFLNSDTAFLEIIDSTDLRYSDSEIELFMGEPKITCVQYSPPAYLLEFTKSGNVWQSDGVTLLPVCPAGLSYVVKGNTNHAICEGTDIPILMYYSWTGSSISKDTVYQDSFYVANDMDVTDDGRVMVLLNEDFAHNYNMIFAEKVFNQWQFSRIDTSIGYTINFLVDYSEYDDMPYIMFVEPADPVRTLKLGYYRDSSWEFEDIYNGGFIGKSSLLIDSFGNIHCCFMVYGDSIDELYYGFGQRTTRIREDETGHTNTFDFYVYPNPANNAASISIRAVGTEQTITYIIYDILGRKLYDYTHSAVPDYKGIVNLKLNCINKLDSGMYFVRCNLHDNTVTKKMTIIK
jgi:hypothetical protein